MRFTSPSRRVAGLLAASTIGLSTAVLSVPGVASAVDETTPVTTSPAATTPGSGVPATVTPTVPEATPTQTPAATLTETTAPSSPEAPTTTVAPQVDSAVVAAPAAPVLAGWVDAGDGVATFRFTPGGQDDEDYSAQTWEYQLDGGSWTSFDEGYTNNEDLTGELTGLTNLHEYSLAVRGTSDAGTSPASAPVRFTPYHPVAAPSAVSATVGVTSIRISWTPAADSTGTVKYEGFALPDGAQNDGDVVLCTTADATQTSCTVQVKAGLAYGFGVHGIDADGNLGEGAYGEHPTAVVPASAVPAALPTASAPLTSSDADGKVQPGDTVTVSGAGYLPGSTIEVVVYSTPVSLGTVAADANGAFSITVTLPKDLANGTHHLVATGVDASGDPRYLVSEIIVSGGTGLAYTGFSPAPFLGVGLVALLAGAGLLVATRRRAQ